MDLSAQSLFDPGNLAAWCIVPYDGARRGPVERAAMLAGLGLRHFVWDWRPEHLGGLEAELGALSREGIELDGVWFPVRLPGQDDVGQNGAGEDGGLDGGLDDAGRLLLSVLRRREVSADLWVCTEFGAPGPAPRLTPSEQRERVDAHARALVPAAEAARSIGGRIGLYNHLGWFGEPENQLAVVERLSELGFDNAGLVYNQHHGHAHVERFERLLESVRSRLIALNLNGMVPGGDLTGRKIVPVGHGGLDVELLAVVARTLGGSGWRGRIGLIGHTADDARDRLLDNLEGLAWAVSRLRTPPDRPTTPPGDGPPRARIPEPVLPDR